MKDGIFVVQDINVEFYIPTSVAVLVDSGLGHGQCVHLKFGLKLLIVHVVDTLCGINLNDGFLKSKL